MNDITSIELGDKIREFRKIKGFSQENLADAIHVSKATISRFESGEIIPDSITLHNIAEKLDVYESDFFNRNGIFKKPAEAKNPFKTNRLYVYFNFYNYATKSFNKDIMYVDIEEKPDNVIVNIRNAHNGYVYSTGTMLIDNSMAFLVFRNYQPNKPRLDVCLMEINLSSGVEGLMGGAYFGNSNEHYPSLRKCIFSKEKIDWTKEMEESLKLNEFERKRLEEANALYLDIFDIG